MERWTYEGLTALIPEETEARTAAIAIGGEETAPAERLMAAIPGLAVVTVVPEQWGRDCAPWPAPGLRKSASPFGSGTDRMLGILEEKLLPFLASRGLWPEDPACRGLMGYSLGGLAALYGMTRGFPCGGFASLSGSLWYPGWAEYLASAPLPAEAHVYLSLDNKEPLARHPALRQVGEGTEATCRILEERLGADHVVFEWNEGGHFADVGERFARMVPHICRR